MLETIVIGIILVVFAYVAADRAVALAGGRTAAATSPAEALAQARQLGRIELALYGLLVLGLVGLAITGFVGYLLTGEVRGVLLIGHMLAGGLFATVLPVFLIALAEAARFDRAGRGPLRGGQKAIFWIGVAAAAVSLGTIVLTMLPLLGTHAIETMLTVHRYSGLVLVVLLAPHVYIMNR